MASASPALVAMGKGILKLEDAGFDRKQVEAMVDFIDTERVTTSDLNAWLDATRADPRAEIAAVLTDLSAEIAAARTDLSAEISGVPTDRTAKLVQCRSDLRMEVRTGFARGDGELSPLRWMSGSSPALSLAILVTLFVS
ncbi:MAG: hypothetical protein JNK67_21995 [Alphaproteobacteria bacterium]|nr:hypothetical protein [Alphaproteobacteria bacterium]